MAVSKVELGYIVTRALRSAALTTRETEWFSVWLSKWTPDFLRKAEYTERSVTTIVRNAASAARSNGGGK